MAALPIHAFSPYLHALGGGESYFVAILGILARTRPVTLHVPEPLREALPKLEHLYGLDRERIRVEIHPDGSESRLASVVPTRSVFFQTSNFVPLVIPAQVRVTYHQICLPRIVSPRDPWILPGRDGPGTNRETAERLAAQHRVVVTSRSLGERLERVWGVAPGRTAVLYPRVDPRFLAPVPEGPREPRIVAVGRFDPMKKWDAMIRCFAGCRDRLPPGTRLVLVGPGETEHLPGYRQAAEGLPVDFRLGLSRDELADEYRRAAVLWSLTDLCEIVDGMKGVAESFGMTVAEGQASGAVPVVAAAVGLREVVEAGVNGLHVRSLEELATLTELLLHQPPVRERMSRAGRASSGAYSPEAFERRVLEIFSEF